MTAVESAYTKVSVATAGWEHEDLEHERADTTSILRPDGS